MPQSAPARSGPDAAMQASDSGQVDDIVVTAQRRERRLQEAPVAVTALSDHSLEQLNIADTSDLMTGVPSLRVSTQAGGDPGWPATVFVHGMGQMRAANGSAHDDLGSPREYGLTARVNF